MTRSQKDRRAMLDRFRVLSHTLKREPTLEEVRRIGITPKGYRSSLLKVSVSGIVR